jgi:DNA-binding transcriptional LysR family regulator
MKPAIASLLTRLRGRHLALIVALDDERNVHRAAARVAVTQPAATKLLQEIERMFGALLYERVPGGLEPTDYGRRITHYARLVVADLHQLHDELTSIRQGGTGSVEAGAIMAAVPYLFTGATRKLRTTHPRLKIKLLMETSDVLLPLLSQAKLDVVLGRLPDGDKAEEIEFEPLDEERLCVICGVDNPLARSRRATLATLASHPWVLQSPRSPMRLLIDQEFADAGNVQPNVVAETSSILATFALLHDSDCVSVTPETVATYFKGRGMVSMLPIKLRRSLRPYGILTRRGRWVSTSVRIFIDAVRQSARRPPTG